MSESFIPALSMGDLVSRGSDIGIVTSEPVNGLVRVRWNPEAAEDQQMVRVTELQVVPGRSKIGTRAVVARYSRGKAKDYTDPHRHGRKAKGGPIERRYITPEKGA